MKKYKMKIIMIVIMLFFCFNSFAFAKEIKIVYGKEDITKKVYPAIAKGEVYVIDEPFMNILGHPLSQPRFKKTNDKLEQYAMRYGTYENSSECIMDFTRHEDIYIYTNSTLVKYHSFSKDNEYNLNLSSAKCKEKEGYISIIKEEAHWKYDDKGGREYIQDDFEQIEGKYSLNYIPLEEFCKKVLGKKVFKKTYEDKILISIQ